MDSQKRASIPQIADKIFKETLRIASVARDFLRAALPKECLDCMDVEQLRLGPPDLQQLLTGREGTADLVFEAPSAVVRQSLPIFLLSIKVSLIS